MTRLTWVEIGEDSRRQYIDAVAVFSEWERSWEAKRGEVGAVARLAGLTVELERQRRMNWALRVGRAHDTLVSILKRLGAMGLSDHVTAIGPQSLFAYAAAAGVHLTNHVAPVLDLVAEQEILQRLVILIQSTDSSFKPNGDHEIMNGKGYRVRFRVGMEEGPTMSAIVVSTLGQMGRMLTLHPLLRKDYSLQSLVEEYLPHLTAPQF